MRLAPINSDNDSKKKKTSKNTIDISFKSKIDIKEEDIEPEKGESDHITKDLDTDEGFSSNFSNSETPEAAKNKVPKLIVSEISEKVKLDLEPHTEEAIREEAKIVAKSALRQVLEELNEEEGVNIELFSL